jgi:hypothetical protein
MPILSPGFFLKSLGVYPAISLIDEDIQDPHEPVVLVIPVSTL